MLYSEEEIAVTQIEFYQAKLAYVIDSWGLSEGINNGEHTQREYSIFPG